VGPRANAHVQTASGHILVAMCVKFNVGVANCFQEQVVLLGRICTFQLLVKRCFVIVNNLGLSSVQAKESPSKIHTTSTPRDFISSSFLADTLAPTVHPIAFAICIAASPTLVLPPLMKMLWPGSSLPMTNNAFYAVRPVKDKPAASVGLRWSGLGSIRSAFQARYSAVYPVQF
jgi:hypothetical protein